MDAPKLKLLSLTSHLRGYFGFLEEADHYVYFKSTPSRPPARLQIYAKTEFSDLNHFIAVMCKFYSLGHFLVVPRYLAGLSHAELDRIWLEIQMDRGKSRTP